MKPGSIFYLAYPDEVVRCAFVEDGDGGRNFKRRKADPVLVQEDGESELSCVERTDLYASPLAAAIVSAKLAEEVDRAP